MDISDLQDKLVAVLGYGQEGKAVTNYLLKHGIKPVLFDGKAWEKWPESDRNEIKALGLNLIFGEDCLEELARFEVAFRSPGVKLLDPKLQKWINKGLVVTSQTKWFFEHCPAKVIGVTGTKGKGTTASLIFEILKNQFQVSNFKFQNVYLTGNIGKQQPLEFLDDLKKNDWIVYELSSFQLQDLDRSPHIGVVLMVTSEHLDYHSSNEEYLTAKEGITKSQTSGDIAIINADFKASLQIGKLGQGKKLYFSRTEKVQDGCFVENNRIIFPGEPDTIINLNNIQLRGQHNLENVCAATLTALCAGAAVENIQSAVENFKGLEHRLEFVAQKNSVKFYNDSFSTTPETAIAAIESFSEPLIVILGGSKKNSDFTGLAKTLISKENIRALILIGEEAPTINQALRKAGQFHGKILEGAESMEKIFDQIRSITQKGDTVILSPACASFGMFANYKDRGQQFKYCVTKY